MRSWRVVGLVATAWVVALALLLPGGPTEPAPVPEAPASVPPARAAPAADVAADVAAASVVLAAWDARRAQAWAAGDPAALARLYAPGSRAGATDLRLLRRWHEAGWRVEGLRTQVLALSVVRSTPGRLALRVVDRVAGGRVVPVSGSPDGATERRLPGTPATARTLELRRVGEEWQLVASTPVAGHT